jgi:thymidylate synthase
MEIYAETIAQGWEESILRLLEDASNFIPTEGRGKAKEIRNLTIHVGSPGKEPRVSKKYYFPEQYIQGYCRKFFEQYDAASGDSIHTRIFKPDQVDAVVQKLRQSWYSRRAIISLWRPAVDIRSEYPPCLCMMQILVRAGALHLTAILRSNDAWLSALPDMIVFSELQREITRRLGIAQGEYIHHAISYHIYDYDYSLAQEAFRK